MVHDALATDLPILVEKPLVTNIADGLALLQQAQGRSGIVWVAQEYRYMPPVAEMIRIAHDGGVGRIQQVAIREHREPFYPKVGDWNRFSINTGGTLVEKCCHYFNLMDLILKEKPQRVFASGGQRVNHLDESYGGRRPDILDSAYVIVDYPSGARAMLDLCMFAENSVDNEHIVVVGDQGKLESLLPSLTLRHGARADWGRREVWGQATRSWCTSVTCTSTSRRAACCPTWRGGSRSWRRASRSWHRSPSGATSRTLDCSRSTTSSCGRAIRPDARHLPYTRAETLMPRSRVPLQHAALLLPLALAACGRTSPSTAPTPVAAANPAQRVVTAAGATVPFAQLADAAAKADVVFFGEQHDDEETHRAELALLTAIGERRGKVILSLEMFERDVQGLVNDYLAGRLAEADFRAQSRPWPNYGSDYRPLVELAKAKGWPVVASNVPRRLASTVSKRGLPAVDSLPATDRAFVARELSCPKDKYYENFVEVMGGGHGGAGGGMPAAAPGARSMTDLFYESQCVKDETMAEAIAEAYSRAGSGAIVVHFNGSFHSDFGLGTASRVRRRLPSAKTVVVSAVPVPAPATANAAEYLDRGQFIILAQRIGKQP